MGFISKDRVFVSLYLDGRRKNKSGKCTLKVRVKYGSRTKLYGTGLYYFLEEYEKITRGKRLTDDESNERTLINATLKRATQAAKEPFSFERFERAWSTKGGKADVLGYFNDYINELEKNNKYSTASHYRCALNSLKDFHKNETLPFDKVNTSFLKEYASWMKSNGQDKKDTTISMYTRNIRTIFNQAIRNKDAQTYPFFNKRDNSTGYHIPQPRKGKIPLQDRELTKLKNYKPTKTEQFWYDLFMFSYYTGGMNMKDIAFLENKRLIHDHVSFTRSKTSGKAPVEHSIMLTDQAKEIINRWKCEGKYIFPMIEEGMTPEQVFKTVQSKTRNVNKVMKSIAKKLKLETPVSTMTARHSFVNKLIREGAPIGFISQSLHHTDIKTTQNYISSLPDNTKRKWLKKL